MVFTRGNPLTGTQFLGRDGTSFDNKLFTERKEEGKLQ